ncbi:MAG: sigma-70 family RNA polymerase sigma factor [Propionibacteriaceae bacterium]|nr:sigma-70 family RNA polymerase sigma factor [Propionibacteriaceae bacterium]
MVDTIRGRDSIGLYLDSIAKIPLLSAHEEVELARTIEAGQMAEHILDGTLPNTVGATTRELEAVAEQGRQAFTTFVQANLRLVVSLARKYTRVTQLSMLDLIQEGNAGLIRAVEKFDYAKGYKFSTYATWWVRQAITRGIAHHGHIVRLPAHVAEQVSQIVNARRRLCNDLGREPLPEEIAEQVNMTAEQITELMRYTHEHVSLDAPIDPDTTTSLGDLLAQRNQETPQQTEVDAENRERLEHLLCHLDERSTDIVRRRYGLQDGTVEKVADIGRHWGITGERVRQLERAALQVMARESEMVA